MGSTGDDAPETPRIGGWLIVPLIVLVFSIVRSVSNLKNWLSVFDGATWAQLTSPASTGYHPLRGPTLVFEFSTQLVMFLFSVVVLTLFLRKSSRLPWSIIALMIVSVVARVTDYVLVQHVSGRSFDASMDGVVGVFGAVLSAIIWGAYFTRSTRVRRTFVN